MAAERIKPAMEACGITDYTVSDVRIPGRDLELVEYQHPFLDRKGLLILGNHVTLESGTGCVHTAPGHGEDDFNACQPYPQLPFVMPVDAAGHLTEEAGAEFAGMKVWDANKAIQARLETEGVPARRRAQSSTSTRTAGAATTRSSTVRPNSGSARSMRSVTTSYKAIDSVHWQPAWGHDRMAGMVRRPQRLVHLPPARLGRADPGVLLQKVRHSTTSPIPRSRPSPDLFRKEGQRRLVQIRRQRDHAEGRNLRMRRFGLGEGSGHHGRLVRFRFDLERRLP